MDNERIFRFGPDAGRMRPIGRDEIFVSRLNLLIIMAKAYLKSYPMGEFRRRAISENARFVFYEALLRARSRKAPVLYQSNPQGDRRDASEKDHQFLQRAQLLAVMLNSFTEKESKGSFRKKALAENIDELCEYLANGFLLDGIKILKVA